MIKTITTAILSFAGTNIDDVFILALLFGIAKTKKEKINITAGQFIEI